MAKYCLGGGGKKGVATHKFGTCLNNPEILGETVFFVHKKVLKTTSLSFWGPLHVFYYSSGDVRPVSWGYWQVSFVGTNKFIEHPF